jgi:hypothetical protein
MTHRPTLDQINLVARDMDATVAFYRGLSIDIPGDDARRVRPPSPSPSK